MPGLTTDTHATDYEAVRDSIQDGDLLAFRGMKLIAQEGGDDYSHIGMAVWHTCKIGRTLSCAESREWIGSRVVSLRGQIAKRPGAIDIYRPTCPPELSALAAATAYRWAGEPYNYTGVKNAALLHMPILRRLFSYWPDIQDITPSPWDAHKYCSQFFIWCYRWAKGLLGKLGSQYPASGDWNEYTSPSRQSVGWDLCPRRGDPFVEPSHLTGSNGMGLLYSRLTVKPSEATNPMEVPSW